MSIKRGEKTTGGAKLESVTCILPSHTIETWRLGPSGDLYAQKTAISALGGEKFPSPLC